MFPAGEAVRCMPRYGRSRPSQPIPAGTQGRDGPSPSGTATGPPLPVWEGEIAHAAKGNKHEESSPDTHGKVFLWLEAPWPGGPRCMRGAGDGGRRRCGDGCTPPASCRGVLPSGSHLGFHHCNIRKTSEGRAIRCGKGLIAQTIKPRRGAPLGSAADARG